MTYLKCAAILVVVALSGLFASGSPNAQQQQQQQQNKTFQLAFCNLSRASPIFIAVTHRVDADKWYVAGWYPILDDGCSIIGTFQADTVYFYAFGIRNQQLVSWGGAETDDTASSRCVDKAKAFVNLIAPVPGCPEGQVPVRFQLLKVPPDTPLYKMTLNP